MRLKQQHPQSLYKHLCSHVWSIVGPGFQFFSNERFKAITKMHKELRKKAMSLLLLSRFSRVRLCDPTDGSPPGSSIPGILQARTLEWVAISFSNACMRAKLLQLCPTLCNPTDSSPPGSSVHRTLQARTLEWGCHFLLRCLYYSNPIFTHTHKGQGREKKIKGTWQNFK